MPQTRWLKQTFSQFRRLGFHDQGRDPWSVWQGPTFGPYVALFLLYPYVIEEIKEFSGLPSIRTLIPIMREESINSLSLNFQMTSGLIAASEIVTSCPNSIITKQTFKVILSKMT